MLSKKIVTVVTIASALALGTIGSIHTQSAGAFPKRDLTRLCPAGQKPPCNLPGPYEPQIPSGDFKVVPALGGTKAVVASYTSERKKELLNILVGLRLKDITSLDALNGYLNDNKLIEGIQNDSGTLDLGTATSMSTQKSVDLFAQLISVLSESQPAAKSGYIHNGLNGTKWCCPSKTQKSFECNKGASSTPTGAHCNFADLTVPTGGVLSEEKKELIKAMPDRLIPGN
jgi:hypothetical protein